MDSKKNFTQIFLVLFFIVPAVINSLATTGAFEISLDGKVVFSKLQSGRFPTADELLSLMKSAGLNEMK
jgi:selT/selW/selH-like putative selenoprotein